MTTTVNISVPHVMDGKVLLVSQMQRHVDDPIQKTYYASGGKGSHTAHGDNTFLISEVNEERASGYPIQSAENTLLDFGDVIAGLQIGKKYMRFGWNGKGIYIELQRPDEHSKMTQPYIYIVTTNLQTENEKAPKGIVPWLASQTDMLANDWVEVE